MNWGMTLVGDSKLSTSHDGSTRGGVIGRDGLVCGTLCSPCMIDPKVFQIEIEHRVSCLVDSVYRRKEPKAERREVII